MRKRLLLAAVAVVALSAGGAFGWRWWTVDRYFESTDNAYVEADISVISPRVEGYVLEVRVRDNQQVRAGDVLLVLDDAKLAARAAEARASAQAQRAAITTIDRKLALQQAMIEQAQAAVAGAEAEQARAGADFRRVESLRKDDWVSRQRFDTVEAERRKSDSALRQARANVAAERERTAVLQASRAEAEAKLGEAEASLRAAETDLSDATIRAPIDGVVGNKAVQVGQFVRAGAQLLSIVQLPDVHVVANFKETQLAGIRPGQPVVLEVDAYPGATIMGRVESFAPASGAEFSLLPPENATGNFTKIVQRVPIRVAVPADNPLAGLLRPGLSIEASVDTRQAGDAPLLAGGVFGAAVAGTRAPQR
jgi:membrane fusion protein (multidrug efflux system)